MQKRIFDVKSHVQSIFPIFLSKQALFKKQRAIETNVSQLLSIFHLSCGVYAAEFQNEFFGSYESV